jgi:hypothetical protein
MTETKFLDSAGLTHLLEKTNAKFSKPGHTHTKAEITDFAHTHDDRYYTETEIDSKLNGKSNAGHTHDDRYYTETEIDSKLSGKAASSHKHAAADITSVNASAITGTIAAANLPSGTVPISKGGTGATTAAEALANLGAMPKEKVQAHIANTTIHITAAERAKWNAKADITIGTAEPTSSTPGIFYIQTN